MIEHESMRVLRGMVLRWNRRFSLVSRQDPERQTDELIEECLVSGRVLVDTLAGWPSCPSIRYIDLGTGGGFPGLVWHGIFSGDGRLGDRYLGGDLVEPRSKRAWFLEQSSRAMHLEGLQIHEASWGSAMAACDETPDPAMIVVSMKALHLTDDQVLDGLRVFSSRSSSSVVIVRFVAGWSGDPLAADPPAPGIAWDHGATGARSGFLALPYRSHRDQAALLLSIYSSS